MRYYDVYVPKDKRVSVVRGFTPPKTMNILKILKWYLWDSL